MPSNLKHWYLPKSPETNSRWLRNIFCKGGCDRISTIGVKYWYTIINDIYFLTIDVSRQFFSFLKVVCNKNILCCVARGIKAHMAKFVWEKWINNELLEGLWNGGMDERSTVYTIWKSSAAILEKKSVNMCALFFFILVLWLWFLRSGCHFTHCSSRSISHLKFLGVWKIVA